MNEPSAEACPYDLLLFYQFTVLFKLEVLNQEQRNQEECRYGMYNALKAKSFPVMLGGNNTVVLLGR